MKYIYHIFGTFVCGMIFTANLSLLVGVNESYHAAWWKVIMALIVAIGIFLDIIWKADA